MIRYVLTIIALMTIAPLGLGQQMKEPKPLSYEIQISRKEPISVVLPSPMLEGAVGCTSDGSFVINSILEADTSKPATTPIAEQLNVISPDAKLTKFDLTRIDDLEDVTGARSYDVGERDVVFLIYAHLKSNTLLDPMRAVRNWYVARFDRDGNYHGATDLRLGKFSPQKIAVFSSGDLLIFGADEANRKIQLLRYSTIGSKVFAYQPPSPFASKNDSLPSAFPKDANLQPDAVAASELQGAVQFTQFVHFKGSILLLQMNSGAPIFQVQADGTIRAIPAPKVPGFRADSLLSSDDALYVRYRRTNTNSGKGDDGTILEVDPNTGAALRQIRTGDSTMWDVACARRGEFMVVKLKGDYQFQFFTATLKVGAE